MTATTKRVTPYERLLDDVKEFARSVVFATKRTMFLYPKATLKESAWNLEDLYERTKAADQLGYDVRLVAGDDGLKVQYVKRPDYQRWV